MARKKSSHLIYSSTLTLITILAWVGFETHHQLVKSQLADVQSSQLAPLDPHLNNQVLNDLASRQSFSSSPTP